MSGILLPEIWTKAAGSLDMGAIDCKSYLDGSELVSTVAVANHKGTLTLDNNGANTASLVIKGRTCAAGEAAQFSYTGLTAGQSYTVKVTITTDATPARSEVLYQRIVCPSDPPTS